MGGRRFSGLVVLMTLAAFSLVGGARADSFLTQNYLASQTLATGSLVSLSADPNVVDPANTANANNLLGVVASNQSAYVGTQTPGGVQVATSGLEPVLVSTLNGDIKVGDRIAPSPVAGVGAKTTTSSRILGVAQASFNPKTTGAVVTTLSDGSKKVRASVGLIPVLLNVTYYTAPPVSQPVVKQSTPPAWLEEPAQVVAGHPVGSAKLWLAAAAFLAVLSLCAAALYGTARGSMDSIGRNPLAAQAINRGFGRVAVGAALLLLIGLGIVVVILRL